MSLMLLVILWWSVVYLGPTLGPYLLVKRVRKASLWQGPYIPLVVIASFFTGAAAGAVAYLLEMGMVGLGATLSPRCPHGVAIVVLDGAIGLAFGMVCALFGHRKLSR